jgi:predicted dehydrogenase
VEAGVDFKAGSRLSFRGVDLPVYRTVDDLVGRHQLDDVIVATPTSTHVGICNHLLRLKSPSRILVEKPLATDLRQVTQLVDAAAVNGRDLQVMYHFRTAPEVEWAAERIDAWTAQHGPIVSFVCSFADPYRWLGLEQRAVYVSSWIDSGINALSLVDRFVALEKMVSIKRLPGAFQTYQGTVAFQSTEGDRLGQILTTWHAGDSSKWTYLALQDGTRVVLDHSATLAWLMSPDGSTSFYYGPEAKIDRKTARYRRLFENLFAEAHISDGFPLHLRLHRLLLSGIAHEQHIS